MIPTIDDEEWRQIADFPDYWVSTLGRLFSCRRNPPRLLKPSTKDKGYPLVILCAGESRVSRHVAFTVHTLVLTAFVGPCPEGMECCHWDGNPNNNRLDNLRWDTRRNNQIDTRRHGRLRTKLTPEKVNIIKYRRRQGLTLKASVHGMGVSLQIAHGICAGRIWRHVPYVAPPSEAAPSS